MHSSIPISPDPREAGECCDYSGRLSALHDGELDPASAAEVEKHLASCAKCREELEDLRELSAHAALIGAEGIPASRLRSIHRAIDADDRYSILRIAGVLTGLAASAMVIGSVWLSEIPASRPAAPVVVLTDTGPDWSRVAVDLHVDPLPRAEWEVNDRQMFADARLAEWMMDGLAGRPR
jgi:anti-sigma factor RsiW